MTRRNYASLLTLALAIGVGIVSVQRKDVAWMLWSAGLAAIFLTLSVRRTRNLMLMLSSLLISLAVAETVLAWHDPAKPKTHFDASSGFVNNYWFVTDIGGQPRPGVHTARSLDEHDNVVYNVRYSIGPDGFRITPVSRKTAEASGKKIFRINFLGCSFTFGEGLEDDQTLPYFAQQGSDHIEVKNFGVSGYGVHQALAILQSKRDTSGDLNFLLAAPWLADRSACVPSYASGSPRYRLDPQGLPVRDGFCGGNAITKRSAIVATLKNLAHYGGTQDQQIALYLAIIKNIAAISKQRGQRFIIGFMRADQNYFQGSWSNEKILAAFKQDGIEVIDMTLAARNEDLARQYYISPLDKHPSMQANQARARLLLDYLQRNAS